MAKKEQNIEIYQHTDKIIIFTIFDENNTPKDLNEGTAKWIIAGTNSSSIRLTKTTENDGIIIDGSDVKIFLLDSDTANLRGKFYHELRTIDKDGNDDVSAVGYITINPSLTKPVEEEEEV